MQDDPFDPNSWDFDHQFRMYAGALAQFECLVDEEDYLFFTQWLWVIQKNRNKLYFRRATTFRNGKDRISGSVYLHIEILRRAAGGAPTDKHVADHWNGNSLDNRKKNLRWATRYQNNRNRFGAHFYQRELICGK